ncbi:MAG: hypothetical protein U5L72_17925 [Bacteroidales bacterium]|nr:hypothetical protein [Bacteroidales bacterium]
MPAAGEKEYTDKIRGLVLRGDSKKGGGILNSARLLHETSEEELVTQSMERSEGDHLLWHREPWRSRAATV